jgi:deoxyribodipyrimidine photo-lyase
VKRALIWFRRDLRLADNPALHSAIAAGMAPVPVYIDDREPLPRPGAASDWWLHHSLAALQRRLRARGSDLLIFQGDSCETLCRTAAQTGAVAVYWNRLYEPRIVARDETLKTALRVAGLEAHSCSASLLREPQELVKADGTPYRVFTPFWKALQKTAPARTLADSRDRLPPAVGHTANHCNSLPLEALKLLPDRDWDRAFHSHWQPGEETAWQQLQRFLDNGLQGYADDRDRPAVTGTSRLSPHLHFGEISPLQVWHRTQRWLDTHRAPGTVAAAESFLRELAWRDFAHHLLFHFPQTVEQPLDNRYLAFPWRTDYADDLRRWQRGRTGIPIVDAGLRELWTSGWMHNRVRMLAASLLTKNLLIPWQEGAAWFLDTLVDADLANNTFGWQWTAGCGADAAPYFRIFNPVTQGERFDPDGSYVRRWVPELQAVPPKWIHRPWQAPEQVLADAGVTPGSDYPLPVVDLAGSRKRALAAWERVKRQSR